VPMNLIGTTGKADYVLTGDWSKKSYKEAKTYGQVSVAATGEASKFTALPKQSEWKLDPGASYVHICSNETIGGVQFHWTPDTGKVPLVADMSSDILSRPIDVSKYGLIYAGAQKNIGPSGLTIVVVREDLLGHALPVTPSAFNYKVQAEADSMYNTPPTYAIYIAGLVLKHVKKLGGMKAVAQSNEEKAAVLYDFLDATGFYRNPIAKEDRSRMNVPFWLKDEALDAAFLKGAQERGMIQLKGHRSVGGMRASIYNAMPIEGVKALVQYMKEFERQHG
jgi:phosphoserine aminotransferase